MYPMNACGKLMCEQKGKVVAYLSSVRRDANRSVDKQSQMRLRE